MRLFVSAREYHEKTKYTFDKIKYLYREFGGGLPEKTYKEYSEHPVVNLPGQFDLEVLSYGRTGEITADFGLFHRIKKEPLPLEKLSQLLYLTNGITLVREFSARKVFLRAAPSASRLYPTEIYLLVNDVSGVAPGLYYFSPPHHRLIQLTREAPVSEVKRAGFQLGFLEEAPVVFFLTSVYPRAIRKFQERAYRYCLMDAGYVAQNLVLASGSLGLVCNLLGDFADEEVNRILQVDGKNEAAVLMAPVGLNNGRLEKEEYTFGMIKPEKDSINERFPSLIEGIQTNSSHFPPGESYVNVPVTLPFRKLPESRELKGNLIELPGPGSEITESTHRIIERRRSAHNFLRVPLALNDVSGLLYHLRSVPVLYNFPSYSTYVVVNEVEGLENGIYRYHPQNHKLEQIKKGAFRGDIAYLTLAQDAVFNSSIAFFFSTDFEEMDIFANRGYRYAHLNVGMLGESLYLTATALGLGVRGIGNFFDDNINSFFNVREPHENILGGVIVGYS